MHKKPVYSFEGMGSTGVSNVPIYSIMSIEEPSAGSLLGTTEPVLIIVLAKTGDISTVDKFIATQTNWMWFYNGDLQNQLGLYVKKSGDTMQGNLTMQGSARITTETGSISTGTGSITSGGTISSASNATFGSNVFVGRDLSMANKGTGNNLACSVTGTVWDFFGDNNMTLEINNKRVLTTVTGVEHHDYATPNVSGVIKARRNGNILYMTTNGANA